MCPLPCPLAQGTCLELFLCKPQDPLPPTLVPTSAWAFPPQPLPPKPFPQLNQACSATPDCTRPAANPNRSVPCTPHLYHAPICTPPQASPNTTSLLRCPARFSHGPTVASPTIPILPVAAPIICSLSRPVSFETVSIGAVLQPGRRAGCNPPLPPATARCAWLPLAGLVVVVTRRLVAARPGRGRAGRRQERTRHRWPRTSHKLSSCKG